MTRHLSRKQFTLLRLKWSWPYLACLFVIHLIYWPGSWLAAVSLILLFAAAAGMTLYQRRYLFLTRPCLSRLIKRKTQAKIKRVKMKRTMKAACDPMTTCLLCPW